MSLSDNRVQFLAQRLGQSFQLAPDEVLEQLANNLNEIFEFFNAFTHRLLAFQCTKGRVRLYQQIDKVNDQMTIFVVKIKRIPLPEKRFEEDLCFSLVSDNVVQSLQHIVQNVWKDIIRTNFKGEVEQQLETILEGYETAFEQIELTLKAQIEIHSKVPIHAELFNNLVTNSLKFEKMLKDEPVLIQEIENQYAALTAELSKTFLQINKLRIYDYDSGPEAELLYWKIRASVVENVINQINNQQWIETGKQVLLNFDMKIQLRKFSDTMFQFQQEYKESCENVKYLQKVSDNCKIFSSGDPQNMGQNLNEVLAVVMNVVELSSFYHSGEHITSLMVKVVNRIINHCKNFIKETSGSSSYFDADIQQFYKILLKIQDLNCQFQNKFKDFKTKAVLLHEKRLAQRQQAIGQIFLTDEFVLSESNIFQQFDLFVKRLDDIYFVIVSRNNFASIYDCTLEGLDSIAPQQTQLIDTLRSKQYDLLDFRNLAFSTDVDTYKNGVNKVEQLIEQYLRKIIMSEPSLDYLISVVNQLYLVLNRPNLDFCVRSLYELIIKKYYVSLKQLHEYYNVNKDNQDILQKDAPLFVSQVLWIRFLNEKMLENMKFISTVFVNQKYENEMEREQNLEQCQSLFGKYVNMDQVPPNTVPLLYSHLKVGQKIVQIIKRIKGEFRDGETVIKQKFLQNCQKVKNLMAQPILKMVGVQIMVNFDPLIIDTIRTAYQLENLGYDVPENIKLLICNENQLKGTKLSLQLQVNKFIELHASQNEQLIPLLQPLFNKIIKQIKPAFDTISWTSLNLPQFIDSFQQFRHDLEIVLDQVNYVMKQQVKGNLIKILEVQCLPTKTRPKFFLETIPEYHILQQQFDDFLKQKSHPMMFEFCIDCQAKQCLSAQMQLTTCSLQIAHAIILIVRTIATQYFQDPQSQTARDISEVVCNAIKSVFIQSDQLKDYIQILKPTQRQLFDKIVLFIQFWKQQTYNALHSRILTVLQQLNKITNYDVVKHCLFQEENEYDAMVNVAFIFQGQIQPQPAFSNLNHGFFELRQEVLSILKHVPLWNSQTVFNNSLVTQILPIYEANLMNTSINDLEQSVLLSQQMQVNFKENYEVIKIAQQKQEDLLNADVKQKGNETNRTTISKKSTISSVGWNSTMLALDINEMNVNQSLFSVVGKSRLILVQLASIESQVLTLPNIINQLISFISKYDIYMTQNIQLVIEEFENQKPGFYQYKDRLDLLKQHKDKVLAVPTFYHASIIRFSFENIKNDIIMEIDESIQAYYRSLAGLALKNVVYLKAELIKIGQGLKIPITTLGNIRLSMIAQNELREFESIYEMRMVPVLNILTYLEHQQFILPEQLKESEEEMQRQLFSLRQVSSDLKSELVKIQPDKLKELKIFTIKFQKNLQEFVKEYVLKGPMVKDISPSEASGRLDIFKQRFDGIEKDYAVCKSGEELFGLDETPYPDLVQLRKEFSFLEKLYGLYNNVLSTIDAYAKTSWPDLDFDDICEKMQEYNQSCQTLPKAMKNWQAFLDLKQKIDDFQAVLPLFIMMANTSITERHWKEVSNLLSAPQLLTVLTNANDFKLQVILDSNWLSKFEDIEDIASGAAREAEIEAKFKDLKAVWLAKIFTLAEFKTRGFIILDLKVTADLIIELEEGNMQIQSLRSNKYNKPFKQDIEKFSRDFTLLDERLKQWIQVQQNWSYLEAVFQSGDIARQLPVEARNFNIIDRSWIRIMNTAYQNTNCFHIAVLDDTLSSLLPTLEISLEQCQKQLSGYLESKRLLFPRFCFISDPVLLEILGNQSDPTALQPYFSQIFEAVYSVSFDKIKKNLITGISDRGKEYLELSYPVTAQGPVEEWLQILIINMQKEVKQLLKSSVTEINQILEVIPQMCDQYTGQICLLLIQIFWTTTVETGLKGCTKQSNKSMEIARKKILGITDQLIKLTCQPLTKQRRTSVETLITIHVHQQEVFESVYKMNVRSIYDFEWLKQARFYWNTDKDDCFVQITDINFLYSYEYLGINERLVITPLTDRCYITLAQAIGMCLGGAPAGPAGTGKTETCKDLGKAVGQYCVVFNCSDQMDYRGLGKIFRGIAQGGTYGDFDEFNRIDLAVMSVAAQQISCIFNGIKRKQKTITYTDGSQMSIKSTCAYFITMNPGYAGRVELLENLKALFRSVAMISLIRLFLEQQFFALNSRKILVFQVLLLQAVHENNISWTSFFQTFNQKSQNIKSKLISESIQIQSISYLLMSSSRFKFEKGARTIVIEPNEFGTIFGLASDNHPQKYPSYVAFKSDQVTQYNCQDSILQNSTESLSALNQLELQKITLQAQKDKPQRQDQLAQESLFELKQSDFPDYYPRFDEDFIFGVDCLNIHPLDNYYIHLLFTDQGHINPKIMNTCSVTIVQDLICRYIEYYSQLLYKNLKVDTQQYSDETNYAQANSMSTNIFGGTGRSLLKQNNFQLFHKKRRLDYYVKDGFQNDNFLVCLILPDDVDQLELCIWQEVIFDKLGFEGLFFYSQSNLVGINCGQSCINIQINPRQTKLAIVDAFYPLLNQFQVPIMTNLRVLICALIQLSQNNPLLVILGQMLSSILFSDINKIFVAFGVPQKLLESYMDADIKVQESIRDNLFFQLNQQIIKVFQSGILSLNVDENKQTVIEIRFPSLSSAAAQGQIVGRQLSFSLGFTGLSVARCLFSVHTCNTLLYSKERLQLNQVQQTRHDPLLDQRDVAKTTKIQLDTNEIIRVQINNKLVHPFINSEIIRMTNNYVILNLHEIICTTLMAVTKNIMANELFLKQTGRKIDNQIRIGATNVDDDDQPQDSFKEEDEKTITMSKVKQLAENIVISGCFVISGLENYLIQQLQKLSLDQQQFQFKDFVVFTDKNIDNQSQKFYYKNWLIAAWSTMSDGAIECAVSNEEYKAMGSRIWLEKAPFLYP